MRRLFCTTLAAALFTALQPLPAEARSGGDVYLGVEALTWTESVAGERTVRESDPLVVGGIAFRFEPPQPGILSLSARLEGFGGGVERKDYDADTITISDSDLAGFRLQGEAGLLLRLPEGATLEPFAGFGYRHWERRAYTPLTENLKDETWQSTFGRIGIRGTYRFAREDASSYFEVGARIPLDTHLTVDLPGYRVISDPTEDTTVFAEAGIRWNIMKVSLYYEGLRISDAAVDLDAGEEPVIARAKSDVIGFRVGFSFCHGC